MNRLIRTAIGMTMLLLAMGCQASSGAPAAGNAPAASDAPVANSAPVATGAPAASSAPAASGGHSGMHGGSVDYDEPIDLIPEALGSYRWPVTTDNAQAQAYFDQGMQLRYAYNVNEAARSMVAARNLDPNCAMCYWGEAFALGSFLNGGMTHEKAQRAYTAIVKASQLAPDHANAVEQALIAAAVSRYPADYDPDNRRPVDEAFAAAMAKVYEKYPDNHEVATVYAVALFMLEERRGYRDLASPALIHLHEVLNGVLAEDITHPGACHLYIHATESSQSPELALDCAEHLSASVPIASHIQHMPSHTWNEVGLWGRSVRANTAAWHADQKAMENQGFSYGPTHNLHMLLFAASFDGQGAVATQAGKDFRKISDNSMFEVLTLIRFGRFDEVLENQRRPEEVVAAAIWDFARGYASLKQGDIDTAEAMRDQVLQFAASTEEKFRFHPASKVVGVLGNLLAGEIAYRAGDTDAAIRLFEQAVELEDSLDYDEPEPLPFAARHWLGAALLETNQYEAAEQAYRDELDDHPNNGWSLYGLQQSLAGQGVIDPKIDAAFEDSWARADVWIMSSRF